MENNSVYISLEEADIELIDGDRGKNYPKQEDFLDSGFCLFLSAKNVTPQGFLFNETSFISEDKDRVLRSGKLVRNDIVITTRGTIGNVALFSKNIPFDNIRINSGMLIIRPNQSEWNIHYLYFYLSSKIFQEQITSLVSGSAVPQLPKKDLKKLRIPKYPKEVQDKIANIIGSIQEKIQLNTQTNQTLEQIAQTIYKSWFVDFEPTRAKAAVLAAGGSKADAETAAMTAISGKTAAELVALAQNHPARYQQLADLAAAFPAALTPTDNFSEIPEGWEVKKVGEIAKITKGKKPKNVYPSQESNLLPHILVAALEGKYTEFCETTKITNTLILMDGSASGKIAIGHHGVVGSTLAKMELFDNKYWAVLYHFLKSKEKDIQDNTTGTSIPHADKARINDYSLSICDGYILDFYNQFFKKSLFQSIENRRQSYLLESISDTLLPKLLSGELKQE